MQRDYDLFELLADGSPIWRDRAKGLAEVRRKIKELSHVTGNECYAIHTRTKDVVARVNVGGSRPKIAKKLVAQIGYEHERAMARTALLKTEGYNVDASRCRVTGRTASQSEETQSVAEGPRKALARSGNHTSGPFCLTL
jgi:hypothetical protein